MVWQNFLSAYACGFDFFLSQPKWIAEIGVTDPRRLGKPKNYKYRIEIITKKGTKEWLKQFETKPENEPCRYAIPPDALSTFNDKYLVVGQTG
ncbi:MAG: hypothetical protein AB7S75_10290 [Desulfococcaceae bacterium]